MGNADSQGSADPSERITKQIADLDDWRGSMLAQLRSLVFEAVPDIAEEWKWDSAVWTRKGLVCSAGIFKDHVKLNFFKGASLEDPQRLFNAGMDAKAMRGIDFREGDPMDASALKDLVRAAADFNLSAKTKG